VSVIEPETVKMVKEDSSFQWPDAPEEDLYSVCVHCGLCLEVCPTYLETGDENESPRGRVHLIKEADKGNLPLDSSVIDPVFNCLDCRACETVCPSGVKVGTLIEQARGQVYYQAQEKQNRSGPKRAIEKLFLRGIFPHPKRMRKLAELTRFYQKSGLKAALSATKLIKILPKHLQEMQAVMPEVAKNAALDSLPEQIPHQGARRKGSAALFTGCIMDVMFADVNRATARVCTKNGLDVSVPKQQICCGALHIHGGDREQARIMARHNIDVFLKSGNDYIVVNAAGCGSAMKEYPELFKDDPVYLEKAKEFSARVRDVSELLIGVGLEPPKGRVERKVTYQDACHLCHAQGIRSQPRQILNAIPGLELVEMNESDYCCGSAGIYNLTHPDMSSQILERKMSNVPQQVDGIAMGNPGCMMQMKVGAYRYQVDVDILHTVELLDLSYRREES
jgi:glycolate oxidase iron-sulfur subunit